MVASGVVLMYPMLLAQFLPASLIPAAQVAHSNEAMLAFLVLVIWHIYGAVLSPEVFPIDRSIITGYVSAEELEEHHALEYDRLFPNGHGPHHEHGHADPSLTAAGVAPHPSHAHQVASRAE